MNQYYLNGLKMINLPSITVSPAKLLCNIMLFTILTISCVSLTGCDLARNYTRSDRELNADFQDARNALAPRPIPTTDAKFNDVPELQSYVVEPSESMKAMPLVSVSINQTVPLQDALYELANDAGYDLELDSNIRGSVIFRAHNKPFDQVIERLSNMAGLRYKFDGDVLRIEEDIAYLKTYKIDYLNFTRSNSSSVSNDISVISGDGAGTGSDFSATMESESDFWGELDTNIAQILSVPDPSGGLRTSFTPQLRAVQRNPTPPQPVTSDGSDGDVNVTVQPPEATLEVNSLPTSEDLAGTGASAGAGGEGITDASYALNKQAGLVSIYATEKKHKEVASYLKELKRSVTAQVLIEAKVLEVTLNDAFQAGIQWNAIVNDDFGLTASFPAGNPFENAFNANDAIFNLRLGGGDVSALIEALSIYGTVRALASPRLTVMNNQSAVLNVARNEVYFEIEFEIEEGQDGEPDNAKIETTINTVPEGVLINVLPSINLDERKVSLSLRPSITSIEERIPNPGFDLAVASFVGDNPSTALLAQLESATSEVPVVNVQEFDSVLEVSSGNAIVMGGLLNDRVQTTETGVPVVSEIPLVGNLFKSKADNITKTELVVFLKATIIDDNNYIHNTDRDLYRNMSGDRRPLDL